MAQTCPILPRQITLKLVAALLARFGMSSTTKGDLSLTELKKEINGKTPVLDWAIGQLAREDKMVTT